MNRRFALLAIILIYAAGFRLLVLDRPFHFDAEGSGCLNGVLARNYLRFDWATSRGMPILSVGPANATAIVFYPDHPPLLPLLIVPFYARFGVGAWQTRLPISLLTVAAIFALYRLLASCGTPRVGLIAAAVFAATPMTLYFGGFPDVVGLPLVFFVLLAVTRYLHFHRAPGLDTYVPFVAAFVLAGVCDWPAYIIVPVFLVHFIATRPRTEWRWILAFVFAACAVFVALYVYITLATHASWNWMAPLFTRRSGLVGGNPFTWRQWVEAATAFNRTYHTDALLIASGLWVATFGFRPRQSQPGATVAWLLLGWAALYVVIGSKALYDHEWAWSVLTPGIAVATALLLDSILHSMERFRSATLAGWSMAALLVLFASWTAYTTFTGLYPVNPSRPFAPMELGQAIQAAAPDPGDVALLAGGSAGDAQFWFYGDRALRGNIWSVDDFRRRLQDETVDLVFNFDEQPWKGTASGIVFPRGLEQDVENLRAYVGRRYPVKPLPAALADKFEVFDLRRPRSDSS